MVNKPFTKRIQNQKCFIYKVLNGPMRSQLHLFVKGRITLRASPSQMTRLTLLLCICIIYIFENIVV